MNPENLISELILQIQAHQKALEHMAGSVKGECEMCGGSSMSGQGMGIPYHESCACLPSRKAIQRARAKITKFRNKGLTEATFTNEHGIKLTVKINFRGKWHYWMEGNGCQDTPEQTIANPWTKDDPDANLNETRDKEIEAGIK